MDAETMMLRKMSVLVLPLVLLSPMTSYGDPSGPSNYDECILESMKGVSSDVAAHAIIESCGNLFPKPQSDAQATGASAPPPLAAPAAAVATPAATTQAVVEPAPLDTTGARDLTTDELARLGSKAKVFGDAYRITIDNKNPNLTLTEVTIAVWDRDDSASGRKEYSEAVRIAPETSAEVNYEVRYRGGEVGWSWGIVAARGVE